MNPEANARRALACVALALFVDVLAYTVLVPLGPIYAQRLGLEQGAVSLLFGVYAAALVGGGFLMGAWSDRIGRRLPMIVGLVGLAVATVLFSSSMSFPVLVLARALQGFAASVNWTAGLALLADLTPEERKGRSFSVALSAMTIGSIVGPLFATLVWKNFGLRAVFLLLVPLLAVDLLLRLRIREPSWDASAEETRRVRPLAIVRSTPAAVLATILLTPAITTALESSWPAHLLGEGFSLETSGWLFGLLGLASLLAYPVAGRLIDAGKTRAAFVAGGIGLGVALPLFAVATPWAPWLGVITLGAGIALASAPLLPILTRVAQLQGAGLASTYSLFNLLYTFGLLLGPALSGTILPLMGWVALVAVLFVLGLAVTLTCAFTVQR